MAPPFLVLQRRCKREYLSTVTGERVTADRLNLILVYEALGF